MSDDSDVELAGLEFTIANPVESIGHESRRDAPSATVHPTGLTPLNTAASALLDQLAEQSGLKQEEYSLLLGANKNANLVSVYTVRAETDKAMTFRRSADDRAVTLYLHGVFKDFPSLRPEGKRACRVSLTRDAKGIPCMIINLRGGFAKVKGQRTAAASIKK